MSGTVIDLAAERLARGLPVPVRPEEIFTPPPGKRVGDRVFIPRSGVFGFVQTATPRRRGGAYGDWTLRIDVNGVVYSVGELAVDPAPECGRD